MATQFSTELCTLLVEDNFGELFARIFSTLLRYDRLPLRRLKFHCGLPDRQFSRGLTAMIQHHLVYFFESYDDGLTYYEANLSSAYYLVRSGKIIEYIEETLGKYASTVMAAIMFLGHAQVSHLEQMPELKSMPTVTNGDEAHGEGTQGEEEHGEEAYREDENGEVNGEEANGEQVDGEETHGEQNEHEARETGVNGGDSMEQPAPLHATLKALAGHGYLSRVRESHFQSPTDNLLDAERAVRSRSDIKVLKGRKLEEAIIEGTDSLIKERTNGDLTHGLMHHGVPRGVKRKRGVEGASNKRQRVDFSPADEEEDEEGNEWSDDEAVDDSIPMESGLVVQVNYEKLDVALRNRRFAELAERDTSSVTAHVYECLLKRIEYQTPRCRDAGERPREGEEGEQYSVPISLSAIAEDVDPQLDLTGYIGPSEVSQPLNKRGKRPMENGFTNHHHQAENDPDEDPEGTHTYNVDQHLSLLSQPPYILTSRRPISGLTTWTIEFRHLARKLRHIELERMVESRYGDVALRVIRVLHVKGKLDEKRLQEISLLPFKDLRQVLASMQAGGFVDLQEVPRDAQRQPSRTIYLWFYDPDRICDSLLEDTYKAMSRCLQRMRFERTRLKDFLDKAERSDVKGNEELYLSEPELVMLQQWKAKEALLLGEVARLDDMVAAFRDY